MVIISPLSTAVSLLGCKNIHGILALASTHELRKEKKMEDDIIVYY